MVPTFIPEPFDGIGTQLCPNIIAMVTPQAFTMASRAATSPAQRVPLATHVARVRNVTRPESARFRVGGLVLRGFQPLVPVRIPLRLACRARTIWQYWIRLVVVEDCSTHLARTSEADRPPAITRLLRQTRSGVLSSPQGSRTPRGARYRRPRPEKALISATQTRSIPHNEKSRTIIGTMTRDITGWS